jgi:hypothetical protein
MCERHNHWQLVQIVATSAWVIFFSRAPPISGTLDGVVA